MRFELNGYINSMHRIIIIIIFLCIFIQNCSNITNEGIITTPGITIEAEDGSFVLKSGDEFTAPFIGHMPSDAPRNSSIPGSYNPPENPIHIIHFYEEALNDWGAKLVRIKFSNGAMMYGVFLLQNIYAPADTNYYCITIPTRNFDYEIKKFGVVVCYDELNYEFNWILWLSNIPFE